MYNSKKFLLLFFSPLLSICYAEVEAIISGGDWRDVEGNLIYATEGGFLNIDDTFYMWGMDRSANNHTFESINLYSSTDFKNWKFVNKILTKKSHSDLDNGAVVERAKILHNTKTGQFVMWMHYEDHNAYKVAEVAYATCNKVGGNYVFQKHFRPLNIDSRDLNVYKDEDGKAYLICTTNGNQSVSLFELDDSYTNIVKEIFRGQASDDIECEGHGIIKNGNYYFWLMSWCTGWDFNDNHYFYATSLKGPWNKGGNIAVTNTHTYESQVGFSFTLKGQKKTTFIYLGDRWSVNNFSMSRLVILPIEVSGTTLKVAWYDQWDIDTKTGEWYPGGKNFIDGEYTITPKHSGLVLGVSSNSSEIQQQQYNGSAAQLWRIENRGASHFRITSVATGKCFDVSDESRDAGARVIQYDWKDSYNQKWHIIDCGNGYHRFVAVNTLGKALEIENGSKNTGAPTVIGNFNYKDYQLFRITSVKKEIVNGKKYLIANKGTGKVIEASEDGKISQNFSSSTAKQLWTFIDNYNSYFTITNVSYGTSLDNNNSFTNGSIISHKESKGNFTQQWQLVSIGSGYYKIINRKSGKVLEGSGDNILQADDNSSNNSNQQWKFEVVEKVKVIEKESLLIYTGKENSFLEIYNIKGEFLQKTNYYLQTKTKINKLPLGIYIIKNSNNKENLKIINHY